MAKKFIWLTGIFFLWSAQGVCADTIYMKNGEVIEGKIIADDNGVIVIQEKFEGFGYGESTYLMKNVVRIVTPEEVLVVAEVGSEPPSLEELRMVIGNSLGQYNLITGFYFKERIYRIRYYYPSLRNIKNDRSGVEENVFKVLAVFSRYNIVDFKSIQIEASTVGDKDKGILADAVITQAQFKKYKSSPKSFLIKDIEKFDFFDRFYK